MWKLVLPFWICLFCLLQLFCGQTMYHAIIHPPVKFDQFFTCVFPIDRQRLVEQFLHLVFENIDESVQSKGNRILINKVQVNNNYRRWQGRLRLNLK